MNEQRIIRPNGRYIILPRCFVDVEAPTSQLTMAGRYQLIKRNAYGTELDRTPWFDNILLDSGLNRWGTGGCISGAAIGTGTSTPLATQTQLDTQTLFTTDAGIGGGQSVLGTSPYNNTYTVVYRTPLGGLNGNYSEVGVGWASNALLSRALILDGSGNPTTIAVNSAQQLDIVYQFSVFPPLVDTSNSVTISGVGYTVTGRAMNVNSAGGFFGWYPNAIVGPFDYLNVSSWDPIRNGTIGAITSGPSGSPANAQSATLGSYSNNSLSQAGRLTCSLTEGNVSGGIGALSLRVGPASFQYGFSPVIPKDGTKTLSLDFSVNWARRP